MFSSAQRAHAIHGTPDPVAVACGDEDARKAQPDVEIGTESVQRGTKRTSSTWENCVDKINMEVCDADEGLATVAGVRSEPTQMQECEVFKWRRRYKRSSMETVISTRMSHKAKRGKARPRIVTPECADAKRVPEHYARILRTRTLQSVISRVMSKCRTRQPVSFDTLSAFLHAWLERGVWTEPPTD